MRNKSAVIGHIEIRGKQVPWTVDDNGWFECDIGGKDVRAKTLDDLTDSARKAAQKQKVTTAIPVTILAGGFLDETTGRRARNAILTGLNARTGNVTLRYDDGKTDEINTFSHVFTPFTADDHREFAALVEAERKTREAKTAFVTQREIKPTAGVLVEQAIAEALAKEK